MAVTDWKYPGTAASVVVGSDYVDWTNPNNIKADDTSYATISLNKLGISDRLVGSNFGFTNSDVPSGSAINGIEFIIARSSDVANQAFDIYVYVYKTSTDFGSNLSSATKYPTSITEATYGGATNLCGLTITQAQVVSSDFAIHLGCTSSNGTSLISVDYIKIRVYYTEGGGGPSPAIKVGGVWKETTSQKIKVGGAWKAISNIKVKVSGVWKSAT